MSNIKLINNLQVSKSPKPFAEFESEKFRKIHNINNPYVDYGYKSMFEKANIARNNKIVLSLKEKKDNLTSKQKIFDYYNDYTQNRFFNKKRVNYTVQNNNLKRIQSKEYIYIPKNRSPYLKIQQNKQEKSQIIKNKAYHERYISDIIDNNIKNGHNPLHSYSLNRPINSVKEKDYNKLIQSIETCLKNSESNINFCNASQVNLANLSHSHANLGC